MTERQPPFFEYTRLAGLLADIGADLLLACSRQNVGYLADYTYYVGQGNPTILEDGREWSRAFVGLPADASSGPFMTVQHAEWHIVAQRDPWILDRVPWGPRFRFDATETTPGSGAPRSTGVIEAVVAAVLDRGLGAGRIAIEMSSIPADAYLRLQEQLPAATFVEAAPILWALRLIKSDEELDRLRTVAAITDAAIGAAYAAIDADRSEVALRQLMVGTMAGLGAEFGWTSVAYGPKGTLNIEPTTLLPTEGEIVRIDLVGTFGGYYSDMSRVGSFGRVRNAEARRAHDAILRTNEIMRRSAVPGLSCSELFRIAQESMRRHGYQSLAQGSGHGIGRDVGEPPYISEWDHTVLAPGMVICVEPAMRVPGVGSVNIEDMVVITESGSESLTSFPRDFLVWPST